MTKRIMALLIAAMFVLSSALLVACGGGNDTKTTEPTKAPASSTKPVQSTTEPDQSTTEPAQSTTEPAPSTPTPSVSTPTPPVTPSKPNVDKVNKADDEQGWIKWLADALNNETAEDAGIPVAASGKEYSCKHVGCEEGSWWEIWGDHYHACYQFDTTEYDATANIGTDDYAFTWEIYVRLADTDGDFEKAVTAPWSVYAWGGENPYVIYRIPTYDEGIKSMCLAEDGSSQEYEVIFVVYNGDETTDDANIFFVFQTWVYYTDSTEAYFNEAKAAGLVG